MASNSILIPPVADEPEQIDGRKMAEEMRRELAEERKRLDMPTIHEEIAAWVWVPNDRWKTLGGILSDHPDHDTTKARAAERAWELEHDERKFGPFPKRS